MDNHVDSDSDEEQENDDTDGHSKAFAYRDLATSPENLSQHLH